jgi:prevent-host-death family protein
MTNRANRANFDPMQVNMHEAKSNLSKLVELANDGEEIVIARDGKPVARLVPYQAERATPRPFGLSKGKIWMADDIWEPDLTEDDLDALDHKFDR